MTGTASGCRFAGFGAAVAVGLAFVDGRLAVDFGGTTFVVAGAAFDVTDAGYKAINSLRMEKRYVYWSADVSPDDTPFEAGLGFAVSLKKGDFLGRDALLAQKETGLKRRLECFALETPLPVCGGEAMFANGKAIAEKVCAACHGAEGNKPVAPENPILAGQYPDYLKKAISDYKSGKRANPVMKAFADQLKAKDIEDLAAWFASQKSELHFQR